MSRRPGARTPHPLEWSIGAASALLVAALIGFVLVEAVQETTRIPELSAEVKSIDTVRGGGYRVRFTAVNTGNARRQRWKSSARWSAPRAAAKPAI